MTINIVCYAGGTCGDILTSLIDPKGAVLKPSGSISLPADRSKLKKPHLLPEIQDKLDYINHADLLYNSIPSHDIEFHIQQSHAFVGIVLDQLDTAKWAATRFKQLHRPHVWEEVQTRCGATTTDDYAEMMMHVSRMIKEYTQRTVSLESIRSGQALQQLQKHVPILAGQEIYQSWLKGNSC